MPRPSNLRTRDLEWHRELVAQKTAGKPLSTKDTYLRSITLRNGITLHDLYTKVNKQRAARERQARLVCCGLLPSVLALALHLSW